MTSATSTLIQFEPTPNPQAYKFFWGEKITDQTLECQNSDEASNSPLASKIFGFPWAQSVFIGTDFITIEKQDWVSWDVLAEPLAHLIKEHIDQNEPIIITPAANDTEADSNSAESSDLITKIKWVLEHEIRPAVAMDGGDIQYLSFNQGHLKIAMKGACSGCPSSQITLKEGIETHLKSLFPEVQSVGT